MEIRPVSEHAEYLATERLQSEVWNLPDVEIVPLHVLVTAAKNGGLLLGAFDGDRLAGFVFGFPGLTADGRLKHCSHMAGVHPDYRDQNLGYRLKLAQREVVLSQGIDLITWTFDPLEARNAWLNFHKLGAVCNTYLRNVYGDMRDGLNAACPATGCRWTGGLGVSGWTEGCVERTTHPPPAPPSEGGGPEVRMRRLRMRTTNPPPTPPSKGGGPDLTPSPLGRLRSVG